MWHELPEFNRASTPTESFLSNIWEKMKRTQESKYPKNELAKSKIEEWRSSGLKI